MDLQPRIDRARKQLGAEGYELRMRPSRKAVRVETDRGFMIVETARARTAMGDYPMPYSASLVDVEAFVQAPE